MSKSQTTQTAYGDVEFETVECASCEMEVAKENATRFVIGEPYRSYNPESHDHDWKYSPGKGTRGWACEQCAETSVIGFPLQKGVLYDVAFWVLWIVVFGFGVGVGAWFL